MLKSEKVYFPNLDGLRFIAFLLVFLQHGFYIFFKNFEGVSFFTDQMIRLLFVNGGTGVQIFFVLSGFLITYLILKEVEYKGRLNLSFFYMRRTLRIWPLYFATVLFAFVIYPFLKGLLGIHSDLCSRPWYYFTFLSNFDSIHIAKSCPGRDAMTQGIVWSVSIEEQFYLFWPVLFFTFPRKMYWAIFPLVIFASLAFKLFNRTDETVLYFHTLSVVSDLAIGGLAAWLMLNASRLRTLIGEQSKTFIIGCYLLIAAVLFFNDLIFTFKGSTIAYRLITDFFWAYIIIEQNFSKHSFYKLGSFKTITYWGKYTYGLYMLHPVAILIVDILDRVMHLNVPVYWMLTMKGIVSFALSLLIARLSFHLFEMPFLRLKEKFTVVRNKSLKAAA